MALGNGFSLGRACLTPSLSSPFPSPPLPLPSPPISAPQHPTLTPPTPPPPTIKTSNPLTNSLLSLFNLPLSASSVRILTVANSNTSALLILFSSPSPPPPTGMTTP